MCFNYKSLVFPLRQFDSTVWWSRSTLLNNTHDLELSGLPSQRLCRYPENKLKLNWIDDCGLKYYIHRIKMYYKIYKILHNQSINTLKENNIYYYKYINEHTLQIKMTSYIIK